MDHIGEKFDDMIVLEVKRRKGKIRVVVKCEKCGRTKEVFLDKLRSGIGVSHQYCSKQLDKCKHFHDKWLSMRRRTNNPNCDHYKNYGGRGINSDCWEYYVDFYDDMYSSYREHVNKFGERDTTLERIDVNGNYCKENCTWVTFSEQQGNTQKSVKFKAISPNGKIYYSKNQNEFAREHNLVQSHISLCIRGKENSHKGWKFYRV